MIAPRSSSFTSEAMDEEAITSEVRIVQKPPRPLSAYNLFFKHQRKIIVKERKAMGDVGFCSMAKIVAQRWKKIDAESKKHFDALAVEEKLRHKKAMKEWKALQKKHQKKSSEAANNELSASSSPLSTREEAIESRSSQHQLSTANNFPSSFARISFDFTLPRGSQSMIQEPQGPIQSFVPIHANEGNFGTSFQEMELPVLPKEQVERLSGGLATLANTLSEENNLDPFIQLFAS